MRQGWSVKQMIRQITLSRAYRLGSTYDAHNFEVDPDNTLVWRMSQKRLEAEAIRDAVLAASGNLILKPPVGSAAAMAGEGRAGPGRGAGQDFEDWHRAVYLPVIRDLLAESLTLFDFADPSLATAQRATTSGPSQALYLMNNPFVIRQAEAAARRLRTAVGSDGDWIEAAYLRFLARPPSASEKERARAFLASFQGDTETARPGADRKQAAATAFCQALYASAEFRYID
jgi:hypothetical protein